MTTDAATLDLSNINVSSAVTSQNLAGTTFTVTDANTAAHIVGGSGQDTVIGQGFIFTEDQRNAVFVQGSVDVIKDAIGVYGDGDAKILRSIPNRRWAGLNIVFSAAPEQTITDLQIGVDDIGFQQELFEDVEAILDATHDDGFGNAIISDGNQNTITVIGVSKTEPIAVRITFLFWSEHNDAAPAERRWSRSRINPMNQRKATPANGTRFYGKGDIRRIPPSQAPCSEGSGDTDAA